MQKLCLISFLVVFVLELMSASFAKHSFGCSAINSHRAQKMLHHEANASLSESGEILNISVENRSSNNEPVHSPDCSCPAHRIHCCDSLVMLDKIHRPQFAMPIPAKIFFAESYAIIQAPHLEGPFQPPRS